MALIANKREEYIIMMKRWIVCLTLFGSIFGSLAMADEDHLVFLGKGFAISLRNNKVEAIVLPTNPEAADAFRDIENKIFNAWKEVRSLIIECPANFFMSSPTSDMPTRENRFLMLYSIDISNCKEKKK